MIESSTPFSFSYDCLTSKTASLLTDAFNQVPGVHATLDIYTYDMPSVLVCGDAASVEEVADVYLTVCAAHQLKGVLRITFSHDCTCTVINDFLVGHTYVRSFGGGCITARHTNSGNEICITDYLSNSLTGTPLGIIPYTGFVDYNTELES